MLMITDSMELSYLNAKEKIDFDVLLNKKIFKVADTSFTYRQINSLDEGKLLPEDNDRENGWRKFSLKEVIYLDILKELKTFGLKYEQLKKLWEAFFKLPTGEVAISCALGKVEITLTVDSGGEVIFYDPLSYLFFRDSSKTVIQIQLNEIINKNWKMAGKEEIPIKHSFTDLLADADIPEMELTHKEEELIKIIRDENYNAIRMKKKDGGVWIVNAQRTVESKDTTAKDVLRALNAKDYQEVSLIKKDGKIVNFKIEETIKLS